MTRQKSMKSSVRAKSKKEAVKKLKARLIHPKEWVATKVIVTNPTKEYEVTWKKRKKRKK